MRISSVIWKEEEGYDVGIFISLNKDYFRH